MRAQKFTEVAPFVTATQEFPQTWPMTASEKVWQTLPAAQQAILVEAANEAGRLYTRLTGERAEGDIRAMIEKDNAVFMRINTEPFRKAMEPLYDELIKEGILKKEVYEAVKALAGG